MVGTMAGIYGSLAGTQNRGWSVGMKGGMMKMIVMARGGLVAGFAFGSFFLGFQED
jgi:hypothetical protein